MHEFDHFRKLQYNYEIVPSDKEYSVSVWGKQIKEQKIDYVMFCVWERALS